MSTLCPDPAWNAAEAVAPVGPLSPAPAGALAPERHATESPVHLGPLSVDYRESAEVLLRGTGVFTDDEIRIGLEVLDGSLVYPGQDYTSVGAFTPEGGLLGFIVYGPTPCTTGTWDLYWIAVDRSAHGRGIGTLLLQEMERRLARLSARLVLIETSSRPEYEATRAFYLRRGYAEVARVPDFYAVGDDQVIFARKPDV